MEMGVDTRMKYSEDYSADYIEMHAYLEDRNRFKFRVLHGNEDEQERFQGVMLWTWQQNEQKITEKAREELIHLFRRKVKFIMMILQLSRRATERLYTPGGAGFE